SYSACDGNALLRQERSKRQWGPSTAFGWRLTALRMTGEQRPRKQLANSNSNRNQALLLGDPLIFAALPGSGPLVPRSLIARSGSPEMIGMKVRRSRLQLQSRAYFRVRFEVANCDLKHASPD